MTAESEKIDFFISHAGGDSAWAEWVDQVLRRSGYTTITDLYEFKAGENFILLMEDALKRADKLLLIWSPRAKDRHMVEVEWSGVMAHHRNRIIPIIVEECEVPAVLRATLHVNLTEFSDGPAASEALVGALQGRVRPTETVEYPGATHRRNGHSATGVAANSNDKAARKFSVDEHIFPRPDHSTFFVSPDIKEVWMLAKGFESFLHNNARQVDQAVARGTKFRFLMHDPSNSELMKMMALTSYSNRKFGDVASRLHGAVEQIQQLASGRGATVELRLTSWPIVSGCTIFQPSHPLGSAYMELFGYRISLNERRALTVSRERDPEFFNYLRELYLSQWRDAKKVEWDD